MDAIIENAGSEVLVPNSIENGKELEISKANNKNKYNEQIFTGDFSTT